MSTLSTPPLHFYIMFCLVSYHIMSHVPAGEEVCTGYMSPLLPTLLRRRHLHASWHFWCGCARCADNTEGGSSYSSLLCPLDRWSQDTPILIGPSNVIMSLVHN